jgi:uncharacterized protein YqjF (DUF2071 family)
MLPLIMPKVFLSAEWRNLLMANYKIDPAILQPYLPCHTELDEFNGIYYVSLVGFFSQIQKFAELLSLFIEHLKRSIFDFMSAIKKTVCGNAELFL